MTQDTRYFSEPPPGESVLKPIGNEAPGQVVAIDNNQRVGSPELHELLKHWDYYENSIPGAPQKALDRRAGQK